MIHLQVPDLPSAGLSILNLLLKELLVLESFRVRMHKLLNLSAFTPCLRLAQQIPFGGAAASKLLRSPHASIANCK